MGNWYHYVCAGLHDSQYVNCKKGYKSVQNDIRRGNWGKELIAPYFALPNKKKREIVRLIYREGYSLADAYAKVNPTPEPEPPNEFPEPEPSPDAGQQPVQIEDKSNWSYLIIAMIAIIFIGYIFSVKK